MHQLQELSKLPLPGDHVERITVEKMQYYGGGLSKERGRVDPADLINLTIVTGGAVSILGRQYPTAQTATPVPMSWKGQVPKKIHHKRLMKGLGIPFEVSKQFGVIPDWPDNVLIPEPIPANKIQHVLDAIGLAVWSAGGAFSKLCLNPAP